MKIIATRKNKDGSYDEVGMNNRTVFTGAAEGHIRKKAAAWAKGPHRLEYFHGDKIYGNPHKTVHVKEDTEVNEQYEPDRTISGWLKRRREAKAAKSAARRDPVLPMPKSAVAPHQEPSFDNTHHHLSMTLHHQSAPRNDDVEINASPSPYKSNLMKNGNLKGTRKLDKKERKRAQGRATHYNTVLKAKNNPLREGARWAGVKGAAREVAKDIPVIGLNTALGAAVTGGMTGSKHAAGAGAALGGLQTVAMSARSGYKSGKNAYNFNKKYGNGATKPAYNSSDFMERSGIAGQARAQKAARLKGNAMTQEEFDDAVFNLIIEKTSPKLKSKWWKASNSGAALKKGAVNTKQQAKTYNKWKALKDGQGKDHADKWLGNKSVNEDFELIEAVYEELMTLNEDEISETTEEIMDGARAHYDALIQSALGGNAVGVKDAVNQIMVAKAAEVVGAVAQDTAETMFGTEDGREKVDDDEEDDDLDLDDDEDDDEDDLELPELDDETDEDDLPSDDDDEDDDEDVDPEDEDDESETGDTD